MRNHYGIGSDYLVFAPNVGAPTRAGLLAIPVLTCEMCGIGAGQIDSVTGDRALLHVERVPGKNVEKTEFSVVCSICLKGRNEMFEARRFEPPLLWTVRGAGVEEQRLAYDWLHKKFQQ